MSIVAEKIQPVHKLSEKALRQVICDWDEMFGVNCSMQKSTVGELDAPDKLELPSTVSNLFVETRVQGDCEGTLFYVFPVEFAVELICSMIMLPKDVAQEKIQEGLGRNDLDAFKEISNLMFGSCNNVFQRSAASLRVSQNVDHLKIHVHDGNDRPDSFPTSAVVSIEFEVKGENGPLKIYQVMPEELAASLSELSL